MTAEIQIGNNCVFLMQPWPLNDKKKVIGKQCDFLKQIARLEKLNVGKDKCFCLDKHTCGKGVMNTVK